MIPPKEFYNELSKIKKMFKSINQTTPLNIYTEDVKDALFNLSLTYDNYYNEYIDMIRNEHLPKRNRTSSQGTSS